MASKQNTSWMDGLDLNAASSLYFSVPKEELRLCCQLPFTLKPDRQMRSESGLLWLLPNGLKVQMNYRNVIKETGEYETDCSVKKVQTLNNEVELFAWELLLSTWWSRRFLTLRANDLHPNKRTRLPGGSGSGQIVRSHSISSSVYTLN